jgi:biopolymer transport protein TolQ
MDPTGAAPNVPDPTGAAPNVPDPTGAVPALPDPTGAVPALPDAVGAIAPAMHDMSALGLFLQADPVVKSVMLLLALASIACWAVIIEKSWTLFRLRREARELAAAAAAGRIQGNAAAPRGQEGLAKTALAAGLREWQDGRDPAESLGEYRERIERAMRSAVHAVLRRAEPGLPILATTGSVAPFVGLFGTVWGIMNSFSGIAASNDTSLAVVAPGIAEALFATAIGLVAAIPAVIAYNRFIVGLGRLRQETMAAIGDLAARMVRRAAPDAREAAAMARTLASAAE